MLPGAELTELQLYREGTCLEEFLFTLKHNDCWNSNSNLIRFLKNHMTYAKGNYLQSIKVKKNHMM